MTLSQDTLDDMRAGTGGPNSGTGAPNGHNILGAVNALEDVAQTMDEYGVALADLPAEKRTQYEEAHEDLQHWIDQLPNILSTMKGADDQIELPNGNVVDLPLSPSGGP